MNQNQFQQTVLEKLNNLGQFEQLTLEKLGNLDRFQQTALKKLGSLEQGLEELKAFNEYAAEFIERQEIFNRNAELFMDHTKSFIERQEYFNSNLLLKSEIVDHVKASESENNVYTDRKIRAHESQFHQAAIA